MHEQFRALTLAWTTFPDFLERAHCLPHVAKIAQHNLFLLFSKFSQEYSVGLEPYIHLWGWTSLHPWGCLSPTCSSSIINVPQKLYPVLQKPNCWETISSEMPGKRHFLILVDSLLMKSRTQCTWSWSCFSPTRVTHQNYFVLLQWATYSVLICWRTWENQGNFHTTWDQPLLQNQKIQDWSIKQNNVWNSKSIPVQLLSFIMYKPSMMY